MDVCDEQEDTHHNSVRMRSCDILTSFRAEWAAAYALGGYWLLHKLRESMESVVLCQSECRISPSGVVEVWRSSCVAHVFSVNRVEHLS